jgi:transposase
MPQSGRLTPSQREAARAYRLKGESLRDMGDWFDVTSSTIHYHVKDLPPPPPKPSRRRKVDPAKAERLLEAGYRPQEIAERFGSTVRAVYRAARVHRIRCGLAHRYRARAARETEGATA